MNHREITRDRAIELAGKWAVDPRKTVESAINHQIAALKVDDTTILVFKDGKILLVEGWKPHHQALELL